MPGPRFPQGAGSKADKFAYSDLRNVTPCNAACANFRDPLCESDLQPYRDREIDTPPKPLARLGGASPESR